LCSGRLAPVGMCRLELQGVKARRRTRPTAGSLFQRGNALPFLVSITPFASPPRCQLDFERIPLARGIISGVSCGVARQRRSRAAGMPPKCQRRDRAPTGEQARSTGCQPCSAHNSQWHWPGPTPSTQTRPLPWPKSRISA